MIHETRIISDSRLSLCIQMDVHKYLKRTLLLLLLLYYGQAGRDEFSLNFFFF